MSHPDRERLLDLALGEIEDPGLASHVRACPECSPLFGKLVREQEALGAFYAAPVAAPLRKIEAGVLGKIDRPALRPRRKRDLDPIAAIVGIAVLLFAGVLGFLLSSGSGVRGEAFKESMKRLRDQAVAADNAGRYDEAIAKYKQVLAGIDGIDKYKAQIIDLKGTILELQQRKALRAAADRRFADLKAKFQAVQDEEVTQLQREVKLLLSDAGDSEFPWKNELKEISEKLGRIADISANLTQRLEFQAFRTRINEQLGRATEGARYGEAVREWEAYLNQKPSADAAAKAQAEIRLLNLKAGEDVAARLKPRAARLVDEGRKAEAAEELKRQRPRFDGTAAAKELEALIREIER